MAITKKGQSKKCDCNKPEPIMVKPYVDCPCPPHPCPPPHILLWNSYEEAVDAVNDIHLKPGETHTEFYVLDGVYHCVIGVGNVVPNTKHLILVDNGGNNYNEDIAELLKNVTFILNALKEISQSEQDIDKAIEKIIKQIEVIKVSTDKNTQDITNINVNITRINNNIDKLRNELKQSVDTLDNKIEDLSDKVNKNTSDISELKTLIKDISSNVLNNTTNINKHTEDINNINIHLTNIDKALESIVDISIGTISDPYILSLFHDDIYTVNLCCYTKAGHIEIIDEDGYDRKRVAECTPDNKYKTYVMGDTVTFKAVVNPGYVFQGWWKDGADLHNSNLVLSNIVFNEDTIYEPDLGINLIGTSLCNGEPAILEHGYTAVFRRRRRIYLNTYISPSGASLDKIKVNVKINNFIAPGPDYFFDDGDKIEIVALCQSPNKFIKFVVNDVEYTESKYIIKNATEDLVVNAYFSEQWYKIKAEPNYALLGDVVKSPDTSLIKEGETMVITAIPETGSEFEKWTENGTTISMNNVLTLTDVKRDYSVIAEFKKITYTVIFYDIADEELSRSAVLYGDVISSTIVPFVEPTIEIKPGKYVHFNGWYLHGISEKHELEINVVVNKTIVNEKLDPDKDRIIHVYAKYD